MLFRISHTFPRIARDVFESLFFDEVFNQALCKHLKLQRTLLNRERKENTLKREVQIRPQRDVPKVATHLFDSAKLDYLEHLHYHYGSGEGEWQIRPVHLGEILHSRGTLRFLQQGNEVVRLVEGEVKVPIFGIGKLAESIIVKELQRSYDAAAEFTRRHLSSSS